MVRLKTLVMQAMYAWPGQPAWIAPQGMLPHVAYMDELKCYCVLKEGPRKVTDNLIAGMPLSC